ncbi:hypothetical protein [Brunnivagina elsteri]|uniref:Uncharacterized protein n=1 Tax=Brunnivagina elsteri CCALA 953 TaxID=987040 RepID=A0A2A2TLG3_9CYAN|nr:hypothetical protein [Calothrix elsteri]PAX58064.1 hypothetical protein CK510_08485 [Calothrix elsteri CCALA 953]
MNIKMPRGQEVIQEALEILEQHMEPSKVALLLSLWQAGGDDYLKIREQLFAGETVKTLYDKIQTYQNQKSGM